VYAQYDIEGRQFNLMEGIIDHKTDGHAVAPAEKYIKHGSNKKVMKTTKGWHLCVEWKDGTTSWERLVDLKESNHVEVAEYAATKSLLNSPAFVWWAPRVLQKRTREFGDDAGKLALIVRALYGLKSAGAAFRNHLAECMKHVGWHPCRADRDLWMKAETRPDDGVSYLVYILIYVDDILCVHHDPGSPLAKLDAYFKMKEGSIQVPTFYLGAKLKKTVLPNGVVAWGMSSSKYIQYAVQNVKEYLTALPGYQMLVNKASGPFAGVYKPELDESPELDPTRANFYQSQIGILRWCVELGRIDIITEVSMLSTYLCLPREGHLEAVFHVFVYLGLHQNARVVFDPTYPDVDMGTFIKTDWKFPSDAPIPRGKEVLQASANCGIKCFWSRICCNEEWH
jgi:hypothetical protein